MCMQDAATPTPTRPLDTRVRTGRTPHASLTCTQDVAGRVTLDAVHAGRLMHPRRARLDMNAVHTSSMASTHTHTTCPSRCARLPHTLDAMRTPSTRARSCQTPRADPRRALSTRTMSRRQDALPSTHMHTPDASRWADTHARTLALDTYRRCLRCLAGCLVLDTHTHPRHAPRFRW
jgi:hypothetical protein